VTTLPLHQILSATPISVGVATPIIDVLATMEQRRISCILAVDSETKPVGIFTEQDAITLMANTPDLNGVTMASVMHQPVFTAPSDMDYRDAYRLMSARNYRHLAVVDAAGGLTGVMTEGDFLHHLGMEYLVELKTVSNAMQADPITLPEHASLAEAVDLLASRQASCLLVTRELVSHEMVPVGILTERDLVHLARQNLDQAATTLASVMHTPVQGVGAGTPLQLAIQQMESAGIRRLAVLEGTRLVGLITRHDIVKALQGRYIEYLHETVHRQRLDLNRIQAQDAQLQLQVHALNAAGNAIVITDVEPRILWANAAFSALTGYSLAEAIGHKPAELVRSGKQDPAFYEHMWQTILAGQVWHGELVNKRKDGTLYDEELTITPVRLESPEATGQDAPISHFIAVKQDISERKAVERTLRASEAHFRLFYEHAPVAYESLDASGHILEVNAEWLKQFGYPREQVIGRFIGDVLAPGQEALFKERFADFLRDGAIRKMEYDILHHDGSIVTVAVDGLVDRDEQGNFKRTQCVLHNITARKKMEQELRYIAATDALTGLANRRHFLDQMRLALARHQRHDIQTALLMLDLDWFKQVNDRYGHAVGDEVLQHFASITETSLRRIDLLGRLGGEEFAVLLPDTDANGAYEFAERLRVLAVSEPAHTHAGDIVVTVSIGVTTFAPQDQNIDVILARADLALYRAKANGRNRVEQEVAPLTRA
jgi:diguanylate cyclase (GGDEF)-like protein/PAS domain S-box-containing protein